MSCGIIGYAGVDLLKLEVFRQIMTELEVLQEKNEKSPLGGHGAGLFLVENRKELILRAGADKEKSPVKRIFEKLQEYSPDRTRFFLGHVRRASKEYEDKLSEEFAHPFMAMERDVEIVGIHNGFLSNHLELQKRYRIEDALIDSDVLCKVLLKVMLRHRKIEHAIQEYFEVIEGNNTAAFYIKRGREMWLLLLHTGATRGLVVYENEKGNIVFCSREQPVKRYLGEYLQKNNYAITFRIGIKEHGHFINWWRIEPGTFRLLEY